MNPPCHTRSCLVAVTLCTQPSLPPSQALPAVHSTTSDAHHQLQDAHLPLVSARTAAMLAKVVWMPCSSLTAYTCDSGVSALLDTAVIAEEP